MRKTKWFISLVLITGLMFSCGNPTNKDENNDSTKDSTVAETTATDVIPVDFNKLNDESAFDLSGKTIKISGLVDHICIHGGKRLMLVGQNPNERIEVLAGDHPPFTEDVVGTTIEITGKFIADKIDSTYLADWEEEVKQKSIEGDQTVETKHIDGSAEHKKGEGEGQKEIAEELAKIQQLRDEINSNGKGYIPDFNIEFDSMKKLD